MSDGLKLKSAGRTCSGTTKRDRQVIDGLEIKADGPIDGCGTELLVAEVRAGRPFGDERPMWRVSAPVLICPTCDRGESA